ncbi:hypothetical protein K7432_011560 [Basidiobolus ranarum]|uniref:Oxidoreductase FAD/NAD(P)-binding domain-containing protein n=1 Tax=Basidiobolus ranarum TaxID=34480 RepID=A0ABR2WM72_9FUNG
MKGPVGHFVYEGCGRYNLNNGKVNGEVDNIGMVAGGSGITPCLQVIKSVLGNSEDHTKLSLIFANVTPDDILLREELDQLAEQNPDQFKVWYTVDQKAPSDWNYSVGFINCDMCCKNLPKPSSGKSIVLLCGPPAMIEKACIPNLKTMKYEESEIITF